MLHTLIHTLMQSLVRLRYSMFWHPEHQMARMDSINFTCRYVELMECLDGISNTYPKRKAKSHCTSYN